MKLQKFISRNKSFLPSMFLLAFVFAFSGCIRNMPVQDSIALSDNIIAGNQQEFQFDEMINNAKFDIKITPGTAFSSYVATATGRGKIPAGEYAGQSFTIKLITNYSGLGAETLTGGRATIKIGTEVFQSITSPAFGTFESFCCGEGRLTRSGRQWVFSVSGQVRHTTATTPHNHLFNVLVTSEATGREAGTMNMNIRNQSGTVVKPAGGLHDPNIELITGIDAKPVKVTMR